MNIFMHPECLEAPAPAPRLAILADDLTGANDAAVQFALRGLKTAAALPGTGFTSAAGFEVVVSDTESRDLAPAEAALKVREAAAQLLDLNAQMSFYKKLDSTLRGNAGAELNALAELLRPQFILLAPAFCASGRTTIQGRQLLHGVPLEQTELARVPKSPVTSSLIAEVIGRGCPLPCHLINLETIHLGVAHLRKQFARLSAAGCAVIIGDAATEADLTALATAAAGFEKVLCAGSAGLAQALSELLPARPVRKPQPGAHSVLVLAGSISVVTRAQTRELLAAHPDAVLLRPTIAQAIADPASEAQRVSSEVLKAAGAHPVVVVAAAYEEDDPAEAAAAAKAAGLDFFTAGERMAELMAGVFTQCAEFFDAYILTGGDTAMHALGGLDEARPLLELQREVQPGVPLCRISSGTFADKYLVTKAGAFGTETAFSEAVAALTAGAQDMPV